MEQETIELVEELWKRIYDWSDTIANLISIGFFVREIVKAIRGWFRPKRGKHRAG